MDDAETEEEDGGENDNELCRYCKPGKGTLNVCPMCRPAHDRMLARQEKKRQKQ